MFIGLLLILSNKDFIEIIAGAFFQENAFRSLEGT